MISVFSGASGNPSSSSSGEIFLMPRTEAALAGGVPGVLTPWDFLISILDAIGFHLLQDAERGWISL